MARWVRSPVSIATLMELGVPWTCSNLYSWVESTCDEWPTDSDCCAIVMSIIVNGMTLIRLARLNISEKKNLGRRYCISNMIQPLIKWPRILLYIYMYHTSIMNFLCCKIKKTIRHPVLMVFYQIWRIPSQTVYFVLMSWLLPPSNGIQILHC